MKFSQLKTYISLLSVGTILGIGGSSGVYWLFFALENNGESMDSGTLSPTVVSQPTIVEQDAYDVVPSSSLPTLPTLDRLEDLEEIMSPFDRKLALQVLLVNSDETHVANLLSQSRNLPPNDMRQDVQNAVVQKFAQLNPRRALAHVLAMDSQYSLERLIVAVFREWAHSDLTEAISQVRALSETRRDSALRAILKERTDLPEETRRSIATEVGNDQIAVEVLAEERVLKAMENPEEAWESLVLEFQNSPMHWEGLVQVALTRIEKDGMGVMDQVSTSLTNLQASRDVVHRILQELALSNPSEAFRYALTMEEGIHGSAKIKVLEVWARSDPRSALSAVSGIEEKTLRVSFEDYVTRLWAYKEPRKVLDTVDTLPGHVRESATSTAISEIAENSPEEVAAIVAEMESGDTRTYTASSVANAWLYQDHEATLDWILNEPAIEDLKQFLLDDTLHLIAVADPKLAMNTALAQPLTEDEIGLEGDVFGAVARSDLDTAIELLSQVRKGPTAVYAFEEVTAALIQNGDVDEAVDMVNQIPDSKRPDFYTGLIQGWAQKDPSGMLKSMNRFPSKELKSSAARRLVEISLRIGHHLTFEQVGQARKFLTEKDSKAIEDEVDDTFIGNPYVRYLP